MSARNRKLTMIVHSVVCLAMMPLPPLGGRGEAAEGKPQPPAPPRLKTMGVIGGIGPQATMDFEARIHAESRRRLEPRANGSYPPMVVYYHRQPPFATGEGLAPTEPFRIHPELEAAAARIGPMVDFMVITSNGAHVFRDDVERAAGRPVLSMVECTLEEVARRNWRRVGVMTMTRPTIYAEPLGRRGLVAEVLDAATQARLDQAILRVMAGTESDDDRRLARGALEDLRRRGVDGVILGCTELPMLIRPDAGEADLINPIQLLAESAVEFSMR